MFRKVIAVCLVFLVCIGITAWTEEESPNRVISERLVVQIDLSSWIPQTFTVSPDSKHVAYAAVAGNKVFVVVDGEEGKKYDDIGGLIFSPDSKWVAYAAQLGNSWFVVVEGKEGKKYDGIMEGGPLFSPDSKRVAYAAGVSNKQLVVVDGKEGKKYDGIATAGGGRIIFDSADSLHYLAGRGNSIYLVTERIE